MENTVESLRKVLLDNKEKNIVVVGGMCTGKSTYLKELGFGVELRDAAPEISDDQKNYIYSTDWCPDVGERVLEWRGKKAIFSKDNPIFSTVIIPHADLIVFLEIDDTLLLKRVALRSEDYEGALRMKKWIQEKLEEAIIPHIRINVVE